MMASPTWQHTWQHTWQSWRTFLLNIVQRLSKFRTTTAHKIMSFSSLEALALRWQFDRFDPCPAVHLPKKPCGSGACVCVNHLKRCKTSNLLEFRYSVLGFEVLISFHCILDLHRGNLMFADDCPTKRAAFMTDMTLGSRSHVPAFSTSFLAELHLPCLTTG